MPRKSNETPGDNSGEQPEQDKELLKLEKKFRLAKVQGYKGDFAQYVKEVEDQKHRKGSKVPTLTRTVLVEANEVPEKYRDIVKYILRNEESPASEEVLLAVQGLMEELRQQVVQAQFDMSNEDSNQNFTLTYSMLFLEFQALTLNFIDNYIAVLNSGLPLKNGYFTDLLAKGRIVSTMVDITREDLPARRPVKEAVRLNFHPDISAFIWNLFITNNLTLVANPSLEPFIRQMSFYAHLYVNLQHKEGQYTQEDLYNYCNDTAQQLGINMEQLFNLIREITSTWEYLRIFSLVYTAPWVDDLYKNIITFYPLNLRATIQIYKEQEDRYNGES